jgi:hypothetical protein
VSPATIVTMSSTPSTGVWPAGYALMTGASAGDVAGACARNAPLGTKLLQGGWKRYSGKGFQYSVFAVYTLSGSISLTLYLYAYDRFKRIETALDGPVFSGFAHPGTTVGCAPGY